MLRKTLQLIGRNTCCQTRTLRCQRNRGRLNKSKPTLSCLIKRFYSTSPSAQFAEHADHNHPRYTSSSDHCHHRPFPAANTHTHVDTPLPAELADTLYRRPLPKDLLDFSSPEGKQVFRAALAEGYLESYFPLASQFHTQSEPAYCGLGTLTMVLNALNVDPKRKWKGPWRWFSEELLNCCAPLEVVQKEGITFAEFICLSRCNGACTTAYPANTTTVEHFRETLKTTTSQKDDISVVIVSYDRQELGQTGAGHFSPIGGYHSGKDLALIMDVARFKYPPHWVPVPLLFRAMQKVDITTRRPRGYIVMSSSGRHSHFCKIKVGSGKWKQIAEFWFAVPKVISNAHSVKSPTATAKDVILTLAGRLSASMMKVFERDHTPSTSTGPREHDPDEVVLSEIHQSRLYQVLKDAAANNARELSSLLSANGNERQLALATVVLLSIPDDQLMAGLSATVPEGLLDEIRQLFTVARLPALREEVLALREHIRELCHHANWRPAGAASAMQTSLSYGHWRNPHCATIGQLSLNTTLPSASASAAHHQHQR